MSKEILKVPPQSLESEKALLGSIMLRSEVLYDVTDIIKPECFYSRKNAIIYENMCGLKSENLPIDILSISERLKERGLLDQVGGKMYLTELIESTPTAANALHYADSVQKKYVLRNLITAAEDIEQLGYREADDLDELLDESGRIIMDVTNYSKKKNFLEMKYALAEAWERLERLHKNKGEIRGVPTGFKGFDTRLAGLQNSDLIILAARPSVGKTSLAMDIARNVAIRGKLPVGIFSLEMSNQQLVDRMLAAEASIDGWHLRTGNLRDQDFSGLSDAIARISEAPLFIDDTSSNTIVNMRNSARRLKREKGLSLIIVDYLQIMGAINSKSSDNIVQQVTEFSRSLKAMAKELDVPVLALSQLSREVEKRGGKPRLSDLRDSGSIEQDADVVIFIHREKGSEDAARKNIAEIDIAKHRNGPTGNFELYFDDTKSSFMDLDGHGYEKMQPGGNASDEEF